jgi:hypothetical protein
MGPVNPGERCCHSERSEESVHLASSGTTEILRRVYPEQFAEILLLRMPGRDDSEWAQNDMRRWLSRILNHDSFAA